jgi:hypothetical protein
VKTRCKKPDSTHTINGPNILSAAFNECVVTQSPIVLGQFGESDALIDIIDANATITARKEKRIICARWYDKLRLNNLFEIW